MKPLALLKLLLNIFLILLLAINTLKVLVYLFYLLNPEHDFFGDLSILPDEINNQPITKNDIWTKSLFVIDTFSSLIFIYIILKLKKLVSLLDTLDLFDILQEKLFKNLGFLFILYSLIDWLPLFIYKSFIESSPRKVVYSFDGTGTFWFILILGLLFTYLSYSFQEARFQKEENELTV